jgi:dolichol-phosphate mannosyltransferase
VSSGAAPAAVSAVSPVSPVSPVSVILPTYEERDNIVELIEIVVDDDSPDGTWQVCEGARERFPRLQVIRRTEERGLFTAIRTGIQASRGGIVVWMDCDLSMPPARIPALVAAVDAGADLAVGSRYVPGGRDARGQWLPVLASEIACRFASWVLEPPFRDYTSGFIAMRRSALDAFPDEGDYGEYFIALVYRAFALGRTVVEVPYTLTVRERGESKTATNLLGFLVRGRKYVATVLRLRFSRARLAAPARPPARER